MEGPARGCVAGLISWKRRNILHHADYPRVLSWTAIPREPRGDIVIDDPSRATRF